jgi:hypothetical protein
MTEPVPEPPAEPDAEPTPEPPEPPETDEEEEAEETEEEPTPSEPAEEPTEPEQTGPQGLSPEELEKRWKKSDQSFATYTRAIERIWEEDALELVPVAISPSAPYGFIHKADAGRVPQEVKDSILSFFGMPVEVEYEFDPDKPACNKCKGKGQIATGSQVPNQRHLPCPVCQAKGWIDLNAPPANGPPPPTAVLAAVGAESYTAPEEEHDVWGHPRLLPDGMENPNYGKMPQYQDPSFP